VGHLGHSIYVYDTKGVPGGPGVGQWWTRAGHFDGLADIPFNRQTTHVVWPRRLDEISKRNQELINENGQLKARR